MLLQSGQTIKMYRLLPLILLVGGLFHLSHQQNSNDTSQQIQDNCCFTGKSSQQNTSVSGIEQCECVPYYKCNESPLRKYGIRQVEPACQKYTYKCCSEQYKMENVTYPIPSPWRGCGKTPKGIGNLVPADSGKPQFAEFTWTVAIFREEHVEGYEEPLNVHHCGGALIHPEVVLTAANCVTSKNRVFKIRAGEWNTKSRKEIYPHQDRTVKSIVIHPNYHAGAHFNDIALLFLEEPIEFAWHVDIICLPPQGTVIPPGTRCLASGWGKDVFGQEGKYQAILKKIDLPIVDSNKCQEDLRKTRLGTHFELDKSFICAGGESGKDPCTGDGGGPLICPVPGQKDKFFQAGIVAWGIGCGEKQIPGVYANVPLFIDWINNQMTKRDLDPSPNQY